MAEIIQDIIRISRCGAQFRGDRLEELGLKGCHAGYLMEICADPGLSQEMLAKRICINKSNVARQLPVLEEEGFVQRRPSDTDRRVIRLYPTEKTLAAMPQIRQILGDWSEYVTQDLSPEELVQLEKLLQSMARRATDWMEERS